MSTTINVVGTVATEPKTLTTQSGGKLCSFRLASDERRYDRVKQEWVEGSTNWFGVVCFRSLADHAGESFSKGDRVIVTGRLRIRDWEQGEKRGTAVEIEAEAIGHDIRWGISSFDKRSGASSVPPAGDHEAAAPSEAPTANNDALGQDGFTPANSAAPAVPAAVAA